MTGWIVAAVCAAVAIWSVMRVRGLHREIRDVRVQMERRRKSGSREPLSLVVRDDELEHLVADVDTSLAQLRVEGVATAAREARLRREIADISHDLKTPLIAVRGYLQLVQRDGAAADTSPRRLQTVLERVDDLARLVDDFFELSVLDAGGRRLELGPVDATAVVTEALLGFYVAFETKGMEPTVAVPTEPLLVQAESTALGRVVRNLVANALAHGGGDVAVSLSRKDGQAVLCVANSAPGLGVEEAERLFERFYRADPARTGAHAGLGLSIVQELVRQMGGTLQARVRDGQLRIVVGLPLAST
ncbi:MULTISPECIES: sensor histidine kinase [unclassified Luteococcus]|uniref:sensor histidine kinase n=1 Tax=unclassified Luteococcus TaxID=2639923 RepID=UPI00313BB1DD